MTDTQLYCLKFMFLVYTYGVCNVILAPMEYRPWQFNTYARTYVRKYVGTYGGTLVAAVTLGLQVDCPREPCPLALLENVVVLAESVMGLVMLSHHCFMHPMQWSMATFVIRA